jgi:hypothetical protein
MNEYPKFPMSNDDDDYVSFTSLLSVKKNTTKKNNNKNGLITLPLKELSAQNKDRVRERN